MRQAQGLARSGRYDSVESVKAALGLGTNPTLVERQFADLRFHGQIRLLCERAMPPIRKSPIGWGDLNKALNGLVQAKVIRSYRTDKPGKDAALKVVEVSVASGADQAEVVRRVREALPDSFSGLQVRTRTT